MDGRKGKTFIGGTVNSWRIRDRGWGNGREHKHHDPTFSATYHLYVISHPSIYRHPVPIVTPCQSSPRDYRLRPPTACLRICREKQALKNRERKIERLFLKGVPCAVCLGTDTGHFAIIFLSCISLPLKASGVSSSESRYHSRR